MSDSIFTPPPPQDDEANSNKRRNNLPRELYQLAHVGPTCDMTERLYKTTGFYHLSEQVPRKASLIEGDINCEEMEDADDDIRRKINQKLLKNKNYFVDFLGGKGKQFQGNNQFQMQDQTSMIIDKRSRSETPDKMSATEVLYRAHRKLQERRKESPSKLMEKHQQRQKKAEEFRAQTESSRKDLFEKIKARQQIAKDKQLEMAAEKKAKLQDRLEQAEERRESEIQQLKNKAKQEIQKIDETNYIMKLTMNNMKLDFDNKMNDTQERRNQILEEHKQKQQERHQKEEAVYKRNQELMKERENKYHCNQQKRELADQRRIKMLQDKKKATEEDHKRELVLQRKMMLGDKMSDIMSFVSNSENIWEFLGNETDWQDFGINDERILFDLLSKDHLELEKLKLKMDAQFLNQLIVIEDDQIYSRKELLPFAMRRYQKGNQEQNSSEEDGDIDEEELKEEKEDSPFQKAQEESKTSELNEGYTSDNSEQYGQFNNRLSTNNNFIYNEPVQQLLTDDDLKYMLHSKRLKMSMKRNILKKSMSEDLTWADFLKSDNHQPHQSRKGTNQMLSSFISSHNRSLHSTPERKQEIPNESGNQSLPVETQYSGPSASGSSHSNSKKIGSHKGGSHNQSNLNNSSSSNLSEKSRLSSVVYPSQKKKKPNNKGSNHHNDSKNKKITTNSNSSSTHSLIGTSLSNSFVNQDPTHMLSKKNTMMDSIDSGKKSNSQRMHSSSVTEPASYQLLHSTIQASIDEINGNSHIHTGTQMSLLITNARPIPPPTKIVAKKLSAHASKILFPISDQKILFKRPGKEGQFAKARITIKIEEIHAQKSSSMAIHNTSLNQSLNIASQGVLISIENSDLPAKQTEQIQPTGRKSLQTTPNHNRRQSTDTNNSSSNYQNTSQNQVQIQQESQTSTPTQQSRLQQQHQKLQSTLAEFTSGIPKPKFKTTNNNSTSLPSENSPSPNPKKEQKTASKNDDSGFLINPNNVSQTQVESSQIQTNEQGFKELIIKYLMVDHLHSIKSEDDQKTIALEGIEADKLIGFLEQHDLNLRFCRLCDLVIPDHTSNEAHVQLKSHKKTREELGIKENEDYFYSIFTFNSIPGDIEKELLKEKEKALKRKVKRLKTQMIQLAVTHDSATSFPGKQLTSTNKQRFQILCIDLEKQVIPIIKDYDALELTLKEIIKILDMRKSADLHLMRKLKYIPILIEICKRISVCHKNEFKYIGRMLEYVIKIINIFCGLRENRNYMLQTNRLSALIELLNWCLNRPTQLFYGISFLPQLFHILTSHIKHRVPYECQQMKEIFIEYLVCSQITMKIKGKFQIINGPLDLSEMMGQVPLFLLNSSTFIEALTALISLDARSRPVYEKSYKIAEHVFFVIQNTEMFGIVPMIATILLSRNQPFKPAPGQKYHPVTIQKVLPQTILSLAITSVKILNNIFRMEYRYAQQMLNDFEIQEQLYHLFTYLLVYTVETMDHCEDSKELLHETLLLIGYFCLNNEKHQQIMCKGENTILQKLCNLPFPYFCDKKLKDILFPTLIQASYKNERSLAIMDQEISIEMLVDYIQMNLKDELPKIVEEEVDQQSISSLGHSNQVLERQTNRSPSISSTNSSTCSLQMDMMNGNSPYLPLYMRFPKKLYKDALAFYSSVLY